MWHWSLTTFNPQLRLDPQCTGNVDRDRTAEGERHFCTCTVGCHRWRAETMLVHQLPGLPDVHAPFAQQCRCSIKGPRCRRGVVTKVATKLTRRCAHVHCHAAAAVEEVKVHPQAQRGIRDNATELVGNTPMVRNLLVCRLRSYIMQAEVFDRTARYHYCFSS